MKELLDDLTNPDRDTRLDAYEELSLQMDDAIAMAIADLTTGFEPEEIRADAIIALGPLIEECGMDYDDGLGLEPDEEIGPPISKATFNTIVKRIRAIYGDSAQPKLLRRRAFEVLVRDPQPWQREEIRKLASSPDEEWKLTAIFGMGAMSGFEEELLEAVNTSEGVVLAEAVRSAGRIGLAAAAARIGALASADETERDVRLEAIHALPHIDRDSLELLSKLAGSADSEIAEAAELARSELGFDPDEDEW